ncbi:fucoxanhin chlorophyll binding protein related [Phaeodactylum tricornutum CCAP 1055/1]|uniref:Fucoxanhin chlorophyll binding protein related n=1 Tax=Phaeodactylum tricornutum (strain CCAP 1055/1) TaxID=556484 RepID=B7FRK1_PHATC|nr:fucoxanhin chlorophyll binding protein related [Phaeodactylum tricornutum CCAP 1055/1]EEC51519.1 fucoxanhin chlorophyll binding protein related [Phaeodactylum tricornutum CCAP 1055/1]|eukprot:XP_002177056.1 fucoxanhin chlorophyll binding protein related [Phaeodactylum tricornutum CCAP 1055/1]
MKKILKRSTICCCLGLYTGSPCSYAFRPPPISEEIGCSPTLAIFLKEDCHFFDPLALANDDNFSRFRESELKHGRIAMLAVVESIVTPLLRKSTDWVPKKLPDSILKKFQILNAEDIVRVVVLCGILETLVFVQRDPRDMPGDYATGYFFVRDKALNERKLTVELENGRLAMIAFVGQIAAEFATDQLSWEEQWRGILKGWLDAV